MTRSKKKRLPLCLGDYSQRDSDCNGNAASPPACVFRDRCVAFKSHIRKNAYLASDFLEYCGKRKPYSVARQDSLHSALDRLVVEFGVVDGVVRRRPRRAVRRKANGHSNGNGAVSAAVKKARAAGAARVAKRQRIENRDIVTWFAQCLTDATKCDFAESESRAEPLEFFAVERPTSNFFVIYTMLLGWRKSPVCRIYMRPRIEALEFRITGDYEQFRGVFSAKEMHEMQISSIQGTNGRFNTRIKGVDHGGAAVLARRIAKALRCGIIHSSLPTTGEGPAAEGLTDTSVISRRPSVEAQSGRS